MTQTFGIQPIFPAFLPKQNRDYKRQNGSNQVAFLKILSKMTLSYSVNTPFSLKRKHGSNQVVYF